MRRLGPAVFAMIAAFVARSASAAPDDTFTARTIASMSPAELGHLAGADDKSWVAATLYPAVPLGGGINSARLFAVPEPLSGDVCRVEELSVGFERTGSQDGQPQDDTHYRMTESGASSAYLVADDGGCSRTAIGRDLMARSGADNVFTAPSDDLAIRGAKAFAGVLAAASRQGNRLPFAYDCDSGSGFCMTPRTALTKLDRHRLESIEACDHDDCVSVRGYDGHYDWTMEITFDRQSRVSAVRLSAALEPVY
jgi:hypothetical protein